MILLWLPVFIILTVTLRAISRCILRNTLIDYRQAILDSREQIIEARWEIIRKRWELMGRQPGDARNADLKALEQEAQDQEDEFEILADEFNRSSAEAKRLEGFLW